MPVNYMVEYKIGRLAKTVAEKVMDRGKRQESRLIDASGLYEKRVVLIIALFLSIYAGFSNEDEIASAYEKYHNWCADKLFPANRNIPKVEEGESSASCRS